MSVGSESADVADADRMEVVSLAVCSGYVFGSPCFDSAIEVDDIVVADLGEATPSVPTVDVGGMEVSTFGCGGTVENNQFTI